MSKSLKIVYLIDTLETGGAEKSLIDIAINNKEVTSYFITIYRGNILAKVLESNNITVYKLNSDFKYGFDKVVQLLLPIIDKIQPDLIHSTLFKSDIIARKLKRFRKIPLISSFVNNSYVGERYKKLTFTGKIKLYGFQFMDRITARRVDHFISNSETIKISNAKALALDLDKIRVIFRGRNPETFTTVATSLVCKLRDEFQIPKNHTILFNVSRLIDRKGQLDLLQAFSKLIALHPDVVLLIAGEGSYRKVLEAYIETFNLANKVRLLGNREDVPVLLSLADVFLFPSHYEGLPGALIEAMFSRKRIICSDISENKECVNEQEAVFFEKGNVDDLFQKLNQVVSNISLYDNYAQNAKEKAYNSFELSKVINQYNNCYREVIQNFKR